MSADMSIGFQFRAPVNSAWATPAAMNSEIPLPIPHLDTTSSIMKMMYEPANSWTISSSLAPPLPRRLSADADGTR